MQPAYCVPAFDFCRVRVAAFAVGTATASAHPFLVSRVAYFLYVHLSAVVLSVV